VTSEPSAREMGGGDILNAPTHWNEVIGHCLFDITSRVHVVVHGHVKKVVVLEFDIETIEIGTPRHSMAVDGPFRFIREWHDFREVCVAKVEVVCRTLVGAVIVCAIASIITRLAVTSKASHHGLILALEIWDVA
jgi:hypothetical protein